MNCWIVTGCDQRYFPYACDMVRSVRGLGLPIALGDFGLTLDQRAGLAADGIRLLDFDYPLDFPAREAVETQFPGFGGMLMRPYLDRLLPEADVILWIDSDAWAQEPDALHAVIAEAAAHGLAAVPEIHAGWFKFNGGEHVWGMELALAQRCFGPELAEHLRHHAVINSGLFAARRDHPLWGLWRQYLQTGLARLTAIDDESRMVEQAAFNLAIQGHRLPLRRFPAAYNWLVCLGSALWDAESGLLCDPNPPYAPLKLVHISSGLIGKSIRLPVKGGGTVQMAVSYGGVRAQAAQQVAEPTPGE